MTRNARRRLTEKLMRVFGRRVPGRLPSEGRLEDLQRMFRVEHLERENKGDFRSRIEEFLDLDDYRMEGWEDSTKQRDLSVKFHWGHDHDFGTFQMKGRMGSRHVRHLAEFIDSFGVMPADLEGRTVLDIGCWTGGASLLLCAMGAEVVAVDEVRKYVDCLRYLKHAFALERLEVRHQSLYDLVGSDLQDRFDFVLFAGVLYHVTDPVVALRITFDCLRDGGSLLLESTAYRSRRPLISYARRRWNWFDLSPSALDQMMRDVGYQEIEIGPISPENRIYAVGRRIQHVDMRRDGLSRRDLR